ncbi:RHS repeat-associated core domain-containing protein [Poriferisphaera sp. WC338]|uniref:RHS repeat-associated core domain-containing protein n=1 Tax=Poriferisphaera sp. WC338 TaxID=3425129 RepID=UPI003D815730
MKPNHLPTRINIAVAHRSPFMPLLILFTLIAATLLAPTTASAMLNPKLGRFMQRDPLNRNQPGGGYHDGQNLFQYVGNNPIQWFDPNGLKLDIKRNPGVNITIEQFRGGNNTFGYSDPGDISFPTKGTRIIVDEICKLDCPEGTGFRIGLFRIYDPTGTITEQINTLIIEGTWRQRARRTGMLIQLASAVNSLNAYTRIEESSHTQITLAVFQQFGLYGEGEACTRLEAGGNAMKDAHSKLKGHVAYLNALHTTLQAQIERIHDPIGHAQEEKIWNITNEIYSRLGTN